MFSLEVISGFRTGKCAALMCLFTFRPKLVCFLMDSDPGLGHLHPWLVAPGSCTRSAGLVKPHTATFRGSRSGRGVFQLQRQLGHEARVTELGGPCRDRPLMDVFPFARLMRKVLALPSLWTGAVFRARTLASHTQM